MKTNLLQEVQTMRVLYDKFNRQKGKSFNVFLITGIGERETLLCRMMHDLLSPTGSHGQGALYLKLFVQEVLHLPFSEEDYRSARVDYEFVIADNRRIDLVIRTLNFAIPIEVKIYAGDQTRQCEDYAKWAKNSPVYYVTIDGHAPSEKSMGGLDDKQVCCLSFKEDILTWLRLCVTQEATVSITAIREILIQMMDAIRQFSGLLGDEEMQETLNIVMRDKETMQNARLIKEAYEKSRGEMIRKIFDSLKQQIPLEYSADDEDYTWNNYASIRNYKSKNLPVMWYVVKRNVIDDYHLYMYIEVDWRLYAGFTLFNDQGDCLESEKLEGIIPHLPYVDDAFWAYLPSEEESPNFYQPELENSFYDLFDEAYFKQFIEKCIKRINELLANIK